MQHPLAMQRSDQTRGGAREREPRLRLDLARNAEKIVLAAICAATLLFALVTPPFQAPDEDQHYFKAVLLAEGRLLAEARAGTVGAELPSDAVALRAVYFPPERSGIPTRSSLGGLVEAAISDGRYLGETFAEFPNLASYPPVLYIPQAASILVADAVGAPRLAGFYLGRLANALAGLALLILALRMLPFGRMPMLAVAALPTYGFQSGSLSADALINGVGFLSLSLSLRLGFREQSATRRWSLPAVAPLLGLAKGIYLPLLLAGVRWPLNLRNRDLWIIAGSAVMAIASFEAWLLYSGGQPALYSIVSRKTGETTTTAPIAAQLGVISANPLGYVEVLVTSIKERLPVYGLQIVGRLGWNTILLPLAAYPLAGAMLVAALFAGEGPRVSAGTRLWWLLLAIGGVVLVETALYLTGTPLAADYIQGTQGRYFLSLLPLFGLALMPAEQGPWKDRGRRLFAACALLLLSTGLLAAVDSFWIQGFTSLEGLPPIEHDAPGYIRALLFPSPRW